MRIIVTTCDKFLRYLKGWIYMFNKHWFSDDVVTILGYSVPTFELPENFEFVFLGKQKKYGREWTTALVPFFKRLPDEYFMVMLDDSYILDVNKSLMLEAEKYMKSGTNKIFLARTNKEKLEREKDANFDVMKQDFKYRLSLRPQFVKRNYFLKYLYPGKTVWKYEANFKSFPEGPINDGAQILVPKQDIVPYCNVIMQGKVNLADISRIEKEDLAALKQLGVF